jgi:hypothetical protein
MSQTIVLPGAPAPAPSGGPPTTLAELEQETASRLGPFALLETLTADQGSVTVEVLKSTIDLGGWVDLFVLRREATTPADRVARVKHYDPALGQLQVDRRYVVSPIPSEPVELHHLPPDLLRRGVRAGLRRCFCLFWLALNGDAADGATAPATGPVDLTLYSGGWLRLPQQVMDVVNPDADGASVGGWRTYQHNGAAYLLLPNGTSNVGLSVVAWRDHFSLVNGLYAAEGPVLDDDLLDCDVRYGAALSHAELWRIARPQLEAVAAEARQATQAEAAAEATRHAVLHAPWLFLPDGVRKDRVGPLKGLTGANGPTTAPTLQGALVNGPDWMAPNSHALALRPGRNG